MFLTLSINLWNQPLHFSVGTRSSMIYFAPPHTSRLLRWTMFHPMSMFCCRSSIDETFLTTSFGQAAARPTIARAQSPCHAFAELWMQRAAPACFAWLISRHPWRSRLVHFLICHWTKRSFDRGTEDRMPLEWMRSNQARGRMLCWDLANG